jgi:hypothetical protein
MEFSISAGFHQDTKPSSRSVNPELGTRNAELETRNPVCIDRVVGNDYDAFAINGKI